MIKERYLATTLILCSCITMAMADNVIAESTSFSNNNVPSYENGVLTIPCRHAGSDWELSGCNA